MINEKEIQTIFPCSNSFYLIFSILGIWFLRRKHWGEITIKYEQLNDWVKNTWKTREETKLKQINLKHS